MTEMMNTQGFSPSSLFSEGISLSEERQAASCKKESMTSSSVVLSSNHAVYSPAPVTSHYDECFESLEELEAQTIGNLLPDDDDLLSGVTDGFDTMVRLNNGEEGEELDLFSSVGGFELGDDGFSDGIIELSDVNLNGKPAISLGGEHPLGERPSRTLFVRNINSSVDDSELRMLFEQYGDLRVLYTACKHRGFVMISYYDIRAACNAMKALQDKPLRRRKLDIHFSIPKENPSEKDINQGTLAIFNLSPSVSNSELLDIFGVYGEVKEIRETPHHRFIEFYDVRAAESALNRMEIAGQQIQLELGGSDGSKRFMQILSSELEKEESGILLQQQSPSTNLASGFSGSLSFGIPASGAENGTMSGIHTATGGSVRPFDHMIHPLASSCVPSLLRAEPVKQSSVADSGHIRSHLNFEFQGSPNFHPHSLPDFNNSPSNGFHLGSPANFGVNGQPFCRVVPSGQPLDLQSDKTLFFGSPAGGNCHPGRNYLWNNSHQIQPQPQPVMWPNSPSFVNGIGAIPPQQMHSVHRAPPHMLNSVLPLNNHHVGSAPSINPTVWDRHDGAGFHPGSLGKMGISGNSPHPLDFVHHNMFPRGASNGMDMSIPPKSIGHHQRCMVFPARGQPFPVLSSFETMSERSRHHRNEGNLSQTDNKKQFELDLGRILRGEDERTTLMIKNIPNKYTSKMLLAAIDERHKGTYDFIYLPIDFKNKCNVGYAFINMTEPSLIVPFHKTFNGKKWEKFNSEKVASLAYARIQGKAALIAHFQNSSLMNEDKRCRPILFHTDGPNAGDQVPFPMGTNVRPRPGKLRTSFSEDNNQDDPLNAAAAAVGDNYSNGGLSFGSAKGSD